LSLGQDLDRGWPLLMAALTAQIVVKTRHLA
jgi:hypothetical protein